MGKCDQFIETVKRYQIEPKVIFDLGAFDGGQTLELSSAWPQAKVYAFECVPENIAVCDKALCGNNRITLIPAAVGRKSGLFKFLQSTSKNKECGSFLQPTGKYPDPMPTREIMVPTFALEDAIKFLAATPDIIWMDIQGLELDALMSLESYIATLKAFWAEVTYQRLYIDQVLADQFDHQVRLMGFAKVGEAIAYANWFGDACYIRKEFIAN